MVVLPAHCSRLPEARPIADVRIVEEVNCDAEVVHGNAFRAREPIIAVARGEMCGDVKAVIHRIEADFYAFAAADKNAGTAFRNKCLLARRQRRQRFRRRVLSLFPRSMTSVQS